MGDSWEDDDFVPVVPEAVVLPSKAAWDDEDAPDDPLAGKTPEEVAAEADRRRKAEEARKAKAAKDAERAELRRQAQEEAERMARETPDERALRERLAVEKADHSLADELFGGGGGGGVGRSTSSLSVSSTGSKKTVAGGAASAAAAAAASLNLKSSADFAALAKDLGPKFKKAASSKDVALFVGDLLSKGAKDPLAVDDLNELIKSLQAMAVEKQRQEDANRNKAAVKEKALADKKKVHKAKADKHKQTFGADYDEDDPDMDQYYAMEDEFM